MAHFRPIALVSAFAFLLPLPASAQATRAEQLQQQRAEKAKQLQPDQPGNVERFLYYVEDRYMVERVFNPPNGVFLRFGGLPEGSGLGAGPAFRLSNHSASLTATSAISIRGSWEVDARLTMPRPTPLLRRNGFAEVLGRFRHLPQEDFWGLGQDSSRRSRTSYELREAAFGATAGVTPSDWFLAAGTVEYTTPRIASGNDPRFPSIELLFSDATAPGLDAQTDFLRVGASATLDYTNRDSGTPIGGRYTASYDKYSDRDLGAYSFGRWDVDLQQYIPIVTSSRSIVLRTHVAGVTPDEGQQVPFYLQPVLGGSHSIRGYRVHRLRDRNALLLQAEYRWDVNPFITGSLFWDAGKVAFRRQDLDLKDLKHDYGFGLRFGFLSAVAMRVEVVFGGDEGTIYALRFGDVF